MDGPVPSGIGGTREKKNLLGGYVTTPLIIQITQLGNSNNNKDNKRRTPEVTPLLFPLPRIKQSRLTLYIPEKYTREQDVYVYVCVLV